eukprot:7191558-Alexandrium_andersonii.AAC.1
MNPRKRTSPISNRRKCEPGKSAFRMRAVRKVLSPAKLPAESGQCVCIREIQDEPIALPCA